MNGRGSVASEGVVVRRVLNSIADSQGDARIAEDDPQRHRVISELATPQGGGCGIVRVIATALTHDTDPPERRAALDEADHSNSWRATIPPDSRDCSTGFMRRAEAVHSLRKPRPIASPAPIDCFPVTC